MRKGLAGSNYAVLCLDHELQITEDDTPDIMITQYKGDELEVWKCRDDGFSFVYCNRLEIGYWVAPNLITLID